MNKKLTFALTLLLAISFYAVQADAATIVLRSGATVKGKLVDRTDEEITIQDPDTKQMRIIKSVFIRDLVLDPDEQKLAEKLEKKQKKEKGKDLKLRGTDESEDTLSEIQPCIGIMPGISLPVGKVASKINLGFGFLAFSDVAVPMKTDMFKVRLGLSLGFLYHTTKGNDYSKTIMMLPITAYAKFQFITAVGVRPYIKLGGGITPVLATKGQSIDPTIVAGVGLGYVNPKIPYIEFFIEAGFMMAFEKIRGDFVTANLGFAFRFGAPAPAVTTTPAKKDDKKGPAKPEEKKAPAPAKPEEKKAPAPVKP